MTTLLRLSRLVAIFVALCGASAALAAPDAANPPSPLPSSPLPPLSLNPLATVAPAQMTNFLGRPLFTASRRPYLAPAAAAAAPPAAAPPPSASHIRLIGTVRMPSGASALIEDTTRGVTRTVEDGGMIDGWRVTGIEETGIRIEQGGRTMDLAMFEPGRPPPPLVAPQGMPQLAPATSIPAAVAPQPPAPVARSQAPGAAPAGTMPGTAAAEAAANSPFRLTFGGAPSTETP